MVRKKKNLFIKTKLYFLNKGLQWKLLFAIFVTIIAIKLVLDLLNHHRIRADEHFEVTEEDGVYLNEEGRKIVFCAFDEMMDRRRMLDGRTVSRRQIVETVVCRFIAAIESDEKVEFFKAA